MFYINFKRSNFVIANFVAETFCLVSQRSLSRPAFARSKKEIGPHGTQIYSKFRILTNFGISNKVNSLKI